MGQTHSHSSGTYESFLPCWVIPQRLLQAKSECSILSSHNYSKDTQTATSIPKQAQNAITRILCQHEHLLFAHFQTSAGFLYKISQKISNYFISKTQFMPNYVLQDLTSWLKSLFSKLPSNGKFTKRFWPISFNHWKKCYLSWWAMTTLAPKTSRMIWILSSVDALY